MSLIIPKPCKLCGDPISKTNRDGSMKTKSSYVRQTYCSSKCSTSARYKDGYEKKEAMQKKAKHKELSFIEMHIANSKALKKNKVASWGLGY